MLIIHCFGRREGHPACNSYQKFTFILGIGLTWSESRKMGRLNKNNVYVCYWLRCQKYELDKLLSVFLVSSNFTVAGLPTWWLPAPLILLFADYVRMINRCIIVVVIIIVIIIIMLLVNLISKQLPHFAILMCCSETESAKPVNVRIEINERLKVILFRQNRTDWLLIANTSLLYCCWFGNRKGIWPVKSKGKRCRAPPGV